MAKTLAVILYQHLMKYCTIIFLILGSIKISYSSNEGIDSVLFSKDGQFVLLKEDRIFNCHLNWWGLYTYDNNEKQCTVFFTPDSVFLLSYSDSASFPVKNFCGDSSIYEYPLRIINKFSNNDFANIYYFIPAKEKIDTLLIFMTDTIEVDSAFNQYALRKWGVPNYYCFRLMGCVSGQVLFADTIVTNQFNIAFKEFEKNYNVYKSSDNRFYFVHGSYRYGYYPVDTGFIRVLKTTRFLVKNNR